MAEYQLTASGDVTRLVQSSRFENGVEIFFPATRHIPKDPLNIDWIEYQAWLAVAGHVPDPYVAPVPGTPHASAEARLDAGLAAALTTILAAKDAIHAIPNNGPVPQRFENLLTQIEITMDAFAAMLQAQANT